MRIASLACAPPQRRRRKATGGGVFVCSHARVHESSHRSKAALANCRQHRRHRQRHQRCAVPIQRGAASNFWWWRTSINNSFLLLLFSDRTAALMTAVSRLCLPFYFLSYYCYLFWTTTTTWTSAIKRNNPRAPHFAQFASLFKSTASRNNRTMYSHTWERSLLQHRRHSSKLKAELGKRLIGK